MLFVGTNETGVPPTSSHRGVEVKLNQGRGWARAQRGHWVSKGRTWWAQQPAKWVVRARNPPDGPSTAVVRREFFHENAPFISRRGHLGLAHGALSATRRTYRKPSTWRLPMFASLLQSFLWVIFFNPQS